MQTHILDEIQGMKRIQFKQEDFIGTGAFSNVYCYRIHNIVLAVKCFQDQTKAEEENATLQEIQRITLNCPTIIQYYGMKKLDIEIIGAFSESYNGYAQFFQQCQLDLQKILGIATKLQTKEILNLLSQNINLQAFIIQLISSFNQLKPNVNSQFPSFKSDILNNAFYQTIIFALFEEQSIQLSEKKNIQLVKLHQQLNIDKLNLQQFHKECDNRGPTLTIMHSNEEPNSFFGGMAASSWNSSGWICDPKKECSWLFKIEIEEKKVNLHQWKCINKKYAAFGSSDLGPDFGRFGYGYFGFLFGYFGGGGLGGSCLSTNNDYYQKVNITQSQGQGLLLELSKRSQVNCPTQVQGDIMNEALKRFKLNQLEVFAIKK